jgi:hypothetical protein
MEFRLVYKGPLPSESRSDSRPKEEARNQEAVAPTTSAVLEGASSSEDSAEIWGRIRRAVWRSKKSRYAISK